MIIGFCSYDELTKDKLFKPFTNIEPAQQTSILQCLEQNMALTKENVYSTIALNNYFYSYIHKNSVLYSLIATEESFAEQMLRILNHIKLLLTSDPFNNLFVIDEIFFNSQTINYNLIPVDNLQDILRGDSYEERIYNNMMKSKEIEHYKAMKESKCKKMDNIEKQLEKVRTLELEIRNEQIKQLQNVKVENKNVKTKKTRNINTEGDFVVTIKEKLNLVIDKENGIKECYCNGDLSVKVCHEKYKYENIHFTKTVECKYSPNINKEKVENNVLHSERGYPINKNVALMKWKREVDVPINFSFWVSEISDEKCLVQFEVDYENLNDLVFYIKRNGNNVESTDVVVNDSIEWRPKDEKCLEIICDNYKLLFPIKADFWTEVHSFPVDIKKDANMKVVKVFEVESFEIVY